MSEERDQDVDWVLRCHQVWTICYRKSVLGGGGYVSFYKISNRVARPIESQRFPLGKKLFGFFLTATYRRRQRSPRLACSSQRATWNEFSSRNMDDDYDDDVDVDRWGDLARIDRRFFWGLRGLGVHWWFVHQCIYLFLFFERRTVFGAPTPLDV